METQFEKLTREALELPLKERAAFAQMLLESLDQDPEVDEAWLLEVERRDAEIEEGTESVIPMADALAQIRAQLK